jgi:hypothetical protein
MNTTAAFSEAFRSALDNPVGGVVGLVDSLLQLCPPEGLVLDWQGDGIRVRLRSGRAEVVLVKPLRKSVFRAILARMAVLCNDRSLNSLSPYGGQGELQVSTHPPQTFRVTLTNTASEQELELVPVPPGPIERNGSAERDTATSSPAS